MTIEEANKFLLHGDKARIALKFGCTSQAVYEVACGRLKGKFGRAKEVAVAIIQQAEQNIKDGLVKPKKKWHKPELNILHL